MKLVQTQFCAERLFDNPIRTRSTDWATAPKDYVLYLVKYICPWSGKYLRRGVDVYN